MRFETASSKEKLLKLSEHVRKSEERTGFPVTSDWVAWLLEEYRQLPGALQPQPLTDNSPTVFAKLSDRQKLARIEKELDRAALSEDPHATMPSPFAGWLLAEFDRLGGGCNY